MKLFVRFLSLTLLTLFVGIAAVTAEEVDLRLVDAIKIRDINIIDGLLQEKIDINATQPDGSSALAWAAHWDDLKTAESLIRAGADANLANDYGITPLMLACTNGSSSMVQKLLEGRANPNQAQLAGVTPLMICSRAGNVESAKILLTFGAEANARDSRRGQTALMWAASRQHKDVAQVLTEYGADVNIKTKFPDDITPRKFITYGVQKRDPTKADTFRDEETHLELTSSQGGFTALMFAARKGDIDMAKVLIAAGAKVNDYSPEYGNALVVSAVQGHVDFALFLLDQGADPNMSDRLGLTPLHYSLQGGITAIGMSRKKIPTDSYWLQGNYPELVESLLIHGADANAQIGIGIPPFNYPAFARTTGNSMPEIRQPGMTPLMLAAASFDEGLMNLLVSHGANPLLTTNEGTTALMVASGMGRQEDISLEDEEKALQAIKLAWKLGVNVNAANEDGRTALAAAAYMGANSLIKFLVEKGANLDAKDRYGQTALSIAMGLPYKIKGADKRFRRAAEHKTSTDLLLSLGAKYTQ